MATTYFLGSIQNIQSIGSIQSLTNTYTDLQANDEIYATCTMNNDATSYKVAYLSVNVSGSAIGDTEKINVQVGPGLDGSGGVSGTMKKSYPYTCYISYQESVNYIFIKIPQEIRGSITITVDWEALDLNGARTATYEVNNTNTYDGTIKYGISSSSHCDASGNYFATIPGTYTCYMTAENSNAKYTDCYYFEENYIAVPQKTVDWTLNKGSLTENDWYLGYATSHSVGDTFSVVMQGNNIPQIKNVSITGTGGATAIGKNENVYNFKATKAGNIAISFISEESDYYIECNRITVPVITITEAREEQDWAFPSPVNLFLNRSATIKRDSGTVSSKASTDTTMFVSNTSVASIEFASSDRSSIKITGKGIGTCTLTVTVPEDDDYIEKTQEITITVSEETEKKWSGSLDNENSSASIDIVFSENDRATDGDSYTTTMNIDKSFKYNAGTIRINTSGIKVYDISTGKDVQDFSYIGTISVGSSSEKLEVNDSVSFDINYHMGSSVSIVFNCSLNSSSWEIYGGTITAYWSGVSNNCDYDFKSSSSFPYTGSSQTILNSYDTAHLFASGQSATEVGDYTCTLTVMPQYKATYCLRDSYGLMADSVSQSWYITKVKPEWSISPSTTSVEVGSAGSVTISGEFTGVKSVSQSSSDGGKLDLLGLYRDNVTYMFKGVSAGTVVVTITDTGNDNYESTDKQFTVTVSEKESQTWTALDMSLIYNETKQIDIDGTYYGTLSYDSFDRDIITLNTDKVPAEVRAEKVGSTTLKIIASGDDTHQSHDYTITITVGKRDQNVAIPDLQLSVGQSEYLYYEHGYTPASGSPTFKIASGSDYISINSEIPPKVTAEATGTAIIYFSDAGNEYYFPVKDSPITVTVAEDTRGDQKWVFSSPQDIELGDTIYVTHSGGTIWGDVVIGVEDTTLIEASYDSSTAKLKITANNTTSGKTSIRVEAAGNEYFKPHYQDIEININKHEQTWTLNPSEVSLKIGESAEIEIEGEMLGSTNTYVAPGTYIDVEPHLNETYPYIKVTGKKTVSSCQLIVASTGSTTYEDRSQTAYITVSEKESQTWEANIKEATINIMEYVDISVFGSIYGGLYFSTDSSLITITNKTDSSCRIIAGNSTGTAEVKLYSPGTTAYDAKTEYITIYIKDDLIWVECIPHIYKNGNWTELSPKIYKNNKWLTGTIWKYISKGDIYGK